MSQKPTKSRGLGRGLSALMADVTPENIDRAEPSRADMRVAVDQISPNPDQPRRVFKPEALEELAASIREKGIIQPLIVRHHPADEKRFEIVAGERRWRAAQLAQLHEVPVVVRSFTDAEVLEIAIIENIQRADLNPVDEAAGYRQLMERFGHTQEQLAQALGKSRSHIANQMRLLNLPKDVLDWLADGKLTVGHVRPLIGHENAVDLAKRIMAQSLSARDAEKLAKVDTNTDKRSKTNGQSKSKDADTVQLESELAAQLGMSVQIDHEASGEAGRLTIRYKSLDQLDDLLRVLSGG